MPVWVGKDEKIMLKDFLKQAKTLANTAASAVRESGVLEQAKATATAAVDAVKSGEARKMAQELAQEGQAKLFSVSGASAYAERCGWSEDLEGCCRLPDQETVPGSIADLMHSPAMAPFTPFALEEWFARQWLRPSPQERDEEGRARFCGWEDVRLKDAVRCGFAALSVDWENDALAFYDTTRLHTDYRGLLFLKQGLGINVASEQAILLPWALFSCCALQRVDGEIAAFCWQKDLFYLFPCGGDGAFLRLKRFLQGLQQVFWLVPEIAALRLATRAHFQAAYDALANAEAASDAAANTRQQARFAEIVFALSIDEEEKCAAFRDLLLLPGAEPFARAQELVYEAFAAPEKVDRFASAAIPDLLADCPQLCELYLAARQRLDDQCLEKDTLVQEILSNDDPELLARHPEVLDYVDALGMNLLLYTALQQPVVPRLYQYFTANPGACSKMAAQTNILGDTLAGLLRPHFSDRKQYYGACAALEETELTPHIRSLKRSANLSAGVDGALLVAGAALGATASAADYVANEAYGVELGVRNVTDSLASEVGTPLLRSSNNRMQQSEGALSRYCNEQYQLSLDRLREHFLQAYSQHAALAGLREDIERKRKDLPPCLQSLQEQARALQDAALPNVDPYVNAEKEMWIRRFAAAAEKELQKDEFETSAAFALRKQEAASAARAKAAALFEEEKKASVRAKYLVEDCGKRQKAISDLQEKARSARQDLANAVASAARAQAQYRLALCYLKAWAPVPSAIELGPYDADTEKFQAKVLFRASADPFNTTVQIPLAMARQFKEDFPGLELTWSIEEPELISSSARVFLECGYECHFIYEHTLFTVKFSVSRTL